MGSESLDLTSILFPFPFTFAHYLRSLLLCLLALCVVYSFGLLIRPHITFGNSRKLRRRLSLIPEEWVPREIWIAWLMNLKVNLMAGNSFSSVLHNRPPPVQKPGSDLSSLPTLKTYLEKMEHPVGWETLTLKLLVYAHERGISFLGIVEPLIKIQSEWLLSVNEIRVQFRPILLQLIFCMLIPLFTMGITQCLFPENSTPLEAWILAGVLFSLGILIEILLMKFTKRSILQTFKTRDPASVPISFIFLHLCRLSVHSGMALEQALNFSLQSLKQEPFEFISFQQMREDTRCPWALEAWFPQEWWRRVRGVFLSSVDRGAPVGESISGMIELFNFQWKQKYQMTLKSLPFLMFLPIGILVVPASMILLMSPFFLQMMESGGL